MKFPYVFANCSYQTEAQERNVDGVLSKNLSASSVIVSALRGRCCICTVPTDMETSYKKLIKCEVDTNK